MVKVRRKQRKRDSILERKNLKKRHLEPTKTLGKHDRKNQIVHLHLKKSKQSLKADNLGFVAKSRKRQLLQANTEEDRVISRLEKALKLKKRRKKKNKENNKNKEAKPESFHHMFVDDGLDYILDVVDRKGDVLDSDVSDDDIIADSVLTSSREQSLNQIKKKHNRNENFALDTSPKKPRRLADLLGEEEDKEKEKSQEVSDGEFSDENSGDERLMSGVEDLQSSDATSLVKTEIPLTSEEALTPKGKPKLWEDIYGRLRDKSGNVVESRGGENNVYVPPAKRVELSTLDEQKKAVQLKIQRQLKGLINRLSESNMQPLSSQIEEMYMRNSRNDMNETLYSLITDLVISPALTPPRLVMEQAMLVAILHANVGSEIGAFFLQKVALKLQELFKGGDTYGNGKECDNLLAFLCHLYNFKVTHSVLIFDILKCLIDSFKDKDIELIQLLLRSVGFTLRKDDPLKLKEIIHSVQTKAPSFQAKENSSRIQFMLDTLTAIRNNNMYKIPNYDPSLMEHMKKVFRGLLRHGSSIQELAITFEDLLKAEERGRWWIVGSSWSEKNSDKHDDPTSTDMPFLPKTNASEKILELARKQHMNTEIRKTIFCIIMSAEDYLDCFEKLLHLNLKSQQEQEIVNVILHCALHEKIFNPYYAYLAAKFCKFARKYRMNLQFALWDKFKELEKMKPFQIRSLANLLIHLFVKGDLPLSVLKVIHFSEMNKPMLQFFRQILLGILLNDSEEEISEVFKRIAPAKNLCLLRESLILFMHHFLLRNMSAFGPSEKEVLPNRVKLAEKALNSAKHAFKL